MTVRNKRTSLKALFDDARFNHWFYHWFYHWNRQRVVRRWLKSTLKSTKVVRRCRFPTRFQMSISIIDSCTGRSTLHEIMSRSRIYARINDRINQAVWFLHRFLHRRTGCIGNSRARSVSISISMIESCSGTSTARSAARFKINDWFYHWNRHRRTCYVEIAVLVPLSISMIESIIDSIIEIDIVEQGLSISMIDSCIVEQHLYARAVYTGRIQGWLKMHAPYIYTTPVQSYTPIILCSVSTPWITSYLIL